MQVRPKEETKEFNDKGLVRVFTYGTLKRGHHNHRLFRAAGAVFLGYESITGPYRLYTMGGFPAVLDVTAEEPAGSQTIRGELWAMNPEGLASIDLLEGNPHFYARRKLWTDRTNKRAWVYFLNGSWLSELDDEDLLPENIWEPQKDEEKFWGLGNGG